MNNILSKSYYDIDESIQLGAEGDLVLQEKLLQHPAYWQQYIDNLKFEQGCFFTTIDSKEYLIECEAYPLMAIAAYKEEDQIRVEVFPGTSLEIEKDQIFYDDFDRFMTNSKKGNFPIGFTDSAQNDFFNLCDEFDDDTFKFNGKTFELIDLFSSENSRTADFWTKKYNEGAMGWDLEGAHPFLLKSLDQFKMMKSKVLVLGCGRAHDAAFFAERGHIVTAVDISEKAIDEAKKLYPETNNLKYEKQDVLNLPESYKGQFDYIWDHTFYCAIPPKYRQQLVKTWKFCLNENGRVMGIFFNMVKPDGPPYGGNELELRSRVLKDFRIHYWNRIMEGPTNRLGKEFFCLFEKKN